MRDRESVQKLIQSRRNLVEKVALPLSFEKEEEGGCGVTGFACSIPVKGKHIFEPSKQMHNRGNGLGGGIAAMGLDPVSMGIDKEILREDYLIHLALLEEDSFGEVLEGFLKPTFIIHHEERIPHVKDFREIPGLKVRPPEIHRFFVRVRPELIEDFKNSYGLKDLSYRDIEDEIVYRNSYKLNTTFYDPYGKQRAFVMSHGRDFFILKIVGYAEQVVQYYLLEDFKAYIWIAHQRYPTKGKVWHPGGAHPFVGLNEALVHNGDFANYHSVSEYLMQRNIKPLFLTDTEVSALLFDLYSRIYKYPLEYVIEALAPTMERDFEMLPEEKKKIYKLLQATHIHGSPDGPWFFIIARNDTQNRKLQLIGITDTSMLRPQVFALHDGPVQVGLICSEKQAIDATLKSLAEEDPRVGTVADLYWNARGGSHTDGGAFLFEIDDPKYNGGNPTLRCFDKFGKEVTAPKGQISYVPDAKETIYIEDSKKDFLPLEEEIKGFINCISSLNYADVLGYMYKIKKFAQDESNLRYCIDLLSELIDRRYNTYSLKRRSLLQIYHLTLEEILFTLPLINNGQGHQFIRIDWHTRSYLRPPVEGEKTLVVDSRLFPPEGEECDARLMVEAYNLGWKSFLVFGLKGQRFHGTGFGPDSKGVIIHIYGSSGDYLGSGIDGMEIYVHGNAQDQLGQIMKSGRLVIYGDVGQTFMYGAKGGEAFVLGNAAGRPLINAVGRPRVVINGTCLDYLAESFMAGDPHNGGGFVILNGLYFDHQNQIRNHPTPYPGSNLFSLASGGAIYVRDPLRLIDEDQLNGGEVVEIEDRDWELILPYLKENERLFGIRIEEHLLTFEGKALTPIQAYRKVVPKSFEQGHLDGLEEWE